MKFRSVTFISLFLAGAAPAFAQQRPLVTQDPETVGANKVLVEAGVEVDRDQFYSAYGLTGDTTHVGTFGVSVGVGPATEVQLDGGLVQRLTVTKRQTAANAGSLTFTGNTASSFEDLTVATKIRLMSESASHPALGIRFGTKVPTASPGQGMGLGLTDFFAGMLVGKTVQSVRTVGNVSLLVLGNPSAFQDTVKTLGFGLSVARAITNEFEAVGEVNGRMKPPRELVPPGLESRGILRFAGRYTHNLLRLDAGLLIGITSRDPSFGVTAGATYVIGKQP